MALKIRLRRMGRKNAPTYRVVVAESSMPRDGRIVASIGHYNPRTEPVTLVVQRDEALKWLAKGAVPTDTTMSLLKKAGVFEPAPVGVVESATEAVKSAASAVAGAVKGAAAGVAGAVAAAAEGVMDRITGGDDDQPEAGNQSETAGEVGENPGSEQTGDAQA